MSLGVGPSNATGLSSSALVEIFDNNGIEIGWELAFVPSRLSYKRVALYSMKAIGSFRVSGEELDFNRLDNLVFEDIVTSIFS
jgi:hypothetical protein